MMDCSVGKTCANQGITSSMLLEHVTKLPELEKVTNEIVLELVHFKDHTRECSFQTLYLWIKQLYGKSWPEKPPTIQAIARSISRLSARLAKLSTVPLKKILVFVNFCNKSLSFLPLGYATVEYSILVQKDQAKG